MSEPGNSGRRHSCPKLQNSQLMRVDSATPPFVSAQNDGKLGFVRGIYILIWEFCGLEGVVFIKEGFRNRTFEDRIDPRRNRKRAVGSEPAFSEP